MYKLHLCFFFLCCVSFEIGKVQCIPVLRSVGNREHSRKKALFYTVIESRTSWFPMRGQFFCSIFLFQCWF